MLRSRPLAHALAITLAIALAAAPAAHAKLTDENVVTTARAGSRDLRSPDTRDAANRYAPAATGHVVANVATNTRARSAPDGTPWMLIGIAVAGACACASVGIAKRTRRARVPV